MLSNIISAHILSVFLFITHGWLTWLQEDKVVSVFMCVSSLDYITLPATLKTIHLNGFRQYVFTHQSVSLCVRVSVNITICVWKHPG